MTLIDRIAEVLDSDVQLQVYHLSSPPTSCSAIFSSPPGQRPEKTFCENHFLAIAVPASSSRQNEVIVFAIEVLVYTTAHLTTLFVSKADSTGYLKTLLPNVHSPLKTIATTVLAYLAETRQREGIRLVISLFACAQDQYLFPGSVDNPGKHVLDDRGLIKWWCRILDANLKSNRDGISKSKTTRGYLLVPGCDKYETLSFLPQTARSSSSEWHTGHPLYDLCSNPGAPPRCLIPHFPDDPKSRFLDELDEEIAERPNSLESPSKRARDGQWKSVKSLEQFWEMMAFRQECSSGRVVGFLWVVMNPVSSHLSALGDMIHKDRSITPSPVDSSSQSVSNTIATSPTSVDSQSFSSSIMAPESKDVKKMRKKKSKLTGPITPRAPRIKKHRSRLLQSSVPVQTKYFVWPPSSRGQVVLGDAEYKRVYECLLKLDFSNEKMAAISTRKWIREVGSVSGIAKWGKLVKGRKAMLPTQAESGIVKKRKPVDDGTVNVLGASLVRKKTKIKSTTADTDKHAKGVNILAPDLVRKKHRQEDLCSDTVNVLSPGLIRKKPKIE